MQRRVNQMSNLPEIKPLFRGDEKSTFKVFRRHPRLAVLVLGMHRSGTSAVAGLISMLGVGLPEDLIEAQADNQKGFFESSTIMLAHERLLASAGSSWDSLDDLSGVASTAAGRVFVGEIRAYLEEQFTRSQYLVLKDPRMCRILEIWLPLIDELNADVLAIHVLRNPLAVSASLQARNQFSPGRSILIWLEHVLRAERQTRGLPRLFVNFDDLLADWRRFAARFEAIGIKPSALDFASRIEIESFLSDSIRHHKFQCSDITNDLSLPDWVRNTYVSFEGAARSGDEPDAALLDGAFFQFDLARRLFNDVVRDHKKDIERLEFSLLSVEAETQRQGYELEKTAAREQALAEAHTQLEHVLIALRAAERDRTVHATQLEAALQSLTQTQTLTLREADRNREEALHQRRRADELAAYSKHLERNVRELESAVHEIRASTSWRMTAPLRRALNELRRARKTRKVGATRLADASFDGGAPSGYEYSATLLAPQIQPSLMPPATAASQIIMPRAAPVDIIIPVYRGLETTAACVDSVLASRPGVEHEIVIIDDCSPEPEVSAYVASLAGRPGIIVLRNAENLGFVGTVNRGMALHPDRDVVLLNSDTEVANDWLRRLVSAAYSGPRVSSVTPFSNNATICSYPRFCEDNLLPDGLTLDEIDAQFAEANASKSVDIPTAVGFCMFIRRDCLDEIGSFDEEAFGKGYGEENDFCLRASHHGWNHLLATDTFVFHKGGVSFKETAIAQQAKAAEVIRNRWPHYFSEVAQHVARDPEKPFRVAATALRYKRDARPKILIVTHAYGGGVERHIEDLKTLGEDCALFLTLRPAGQNLVSLESRASDGVRLEFDLDLEAAGLASLLANFGVTRLHIQHTLHYGESFKGFIDRLGLPFDFTIHDYYTICPRIHLGGTDGKYCGEPGPSGCNTCIRKDQPVYDRSITEYRESRAWLLTGAARVISPSHDTAQRIRRYVPSAEIKIVPHVSDRVGIFEPRLPEMRPDETMRVLILGVMAPHKGLAKMNELIEAADAAGADVEVHLLGMVQGEVSASQRFIDHGSYEDPDLSEHIERVDPHLIWFPAQVPETFSYTLEAALASGRPIASSDLGALAERLAERAWSWVWPWTASGPSHLQRILQAREEMLRAAPPPPPESEFAPLVHDGFYQLHYLGDVRPVAGKRRRVVAVDFPVMPTACGQIRIALPLTHPSLSNDLQLDILPLDEALHADADALIVQRNAVVDPDAANRLADHCDRRGIRKLFEIDDDLFNFPDSHPEKTIYEQQMLGARAFMNRADTVIVTTEVLAERMRAYNPCVTVIANNLDDRLWFSGGRGKPRPRRPGEKLRVAFVGGASHQADLDLIAPAMREVMRRRPGALELHMVGANFSDESGLPTIVRHPPSHLAGHYVRFVDWLRRSADWHVGIAPLTASAFNASKSPLKFLDYGALGLAGIYSAGPPFEGVVEEGSTGLLAPDASAWAQALIRLVDDETYRFELAASARAEILNRQTLSANALALRQAWLNLLA